MVRTKAESACRKAVAAKAPRKALNTSAASSSAAGASPSSSKVSKYAGGNAIYDRPTPEWQKGIGGFLKKLSAESQDDQSGTTEACVDVNASSCRDVEQGSSSVEAETGEGSHAGATSSQEASESTSSAGAGSDQGSPRGRNGMISDDDDD